MTGGPLHLDDQEFANLPAAAWQKYQFCKNRGPEILRAIMLRAL
jgi:hypothetical protein